MNQELVVGDVVVLKSGGPEMTVVEMWDENEVACEWFDKSQQVQRAVFPVASLSKPGPRGPSYAVG